MWCEERGIKMEMNKRNLSTIIIYGLALLIYVLMVTIIPFEKIAASWIAFVFGMIAIIASCVTTIYAFSMGEGYRSKLYGFSLFKLGLIYVAVQMFISLVIFIVGAYVKVPSWVSVILGFVVFALWLGGFLLVDKAVEVVETIDKKTEAQVKTMKTFKINVESIKAFCKDEHIYSLLEKLEESFRFSDPVSSEHTQMIEDKIQEEVNNLTTIISNGEAGAEDKIDEIQGLLTSRNAICKRNK